MSLVPVDSRTQDWPRKVAQRANDTARSLETLRRGVSRAKLRFVCG